MIKPVNSPNNQRAYILPRISHYILIALETSVFYGWVILTITLFAYTLRGLL